MLFRIDPAFLTGCTLGIMLLASACTSGTGGSTGGLNQAIPPTTVTARATKETAVPSVPPKVVVPEVPKPTVTGTSAPTRTATPMPPFSPTSIPAPTASIQLKLDMDAIFPQGNGRDLVLNNCTACHPFIRLVYTQRTAERWEIVKRNHRPRVLLLSESDIDALFGYLAANFNETKPVPFLPDWFLEDAVW